ncbi:hypothetical protein K523DRAFT_366367 [Schizophyllum commune Tattone D]|nr:hypothetical protein K523DRAFT_366367 [Schizophyllum commune Tattone D]
MTVHHFVFATFHPSLSPSARAAVFAQVDALLRAQRVPGLRGWCVGPPVGVVASGGKESSGGGERDGGEEEVQNSGDTREGMIAGNERAEGRDFGFAAEFEDMDAFRASLPHEWHHEIYRLVKRVTVGKFFIYQIDTERGRGWRADAGRERGRRADGVRERGWRADAGRERGRRDDGLMSREDSLMSREDTPTASTPDRREEDVQMERSGVQMERNEAQMRRDDAQMRRDEAHSRRDEAHSRWDHDVRRQSEAEDDREAHTWHARGWRGERRWRARL